MFNPYYVLFLYDIQVSVLRMEINQASGDQSVRGTIHDITMGNDRSIHRGCYASATTYFIV